jgi:hypothetical protein
MRHHRKFLYLAIALLLAVWIFRGGRQALCLALLAWLALTAYLLTRSVLFYFVSDTTHATVAQVRVTERPDLDGYANRTFYLTLRYAVGARHYDSSEIPVLFKHYVGDMVTVRYRRSDPQDIHYDY